MGKWTRRALLGTGGVIGGGLLLGVAFAPRRLAVKGAPDTVTTWIRIAPDNTVTAIVPHCDIGQGTQTGLAMMLAEELDADWAQMRVEEAPALPGFANGYMVSGLLGGLAPHGMIGRVIDATALGAAEFVGLQVTGGSASIRVTGELGMRVAGAAARDMLIRAAAARWGVAPAVCTAAAGHVRGPAGQRASFGELAAAAALLDPPADPPLKPREAWKIVGTSPPRFDVAAKTDGSAKYGIDTTLPGMLYATVRAAPVHGGQLVSVNEQAALALKGVKRVIRLDDAVAIVADSYWRAVKALEAAAPVFSDGGNGTVSSADIVARQRAALAEGDGNREVRQGDVDDALKAAAKVISAEYGVPYLAHASMEPPNATVRIANGKCEIWTGVQDPLNARAVAAKAAGLPREAVTLHNCKVGGGFGRKLPFVLDFIEQAARIGAAMSPTPVKLIWSREEDIRRDYYRPTARIALRGGVTADGTALVWTSHYTDEAGDGAAQLPYAIPHQRIGGTAFKTHVRTGAWRSVDHSQHGFFTESFVDELAAAAGQDPLKFRQRMLPLGTRQRALLDLVAEKSGWGTPLPAGTGRGVALTQGFGSIVAQVAEVAVAADGTVRVRRVVAAVDCGDLVHPDAAAAQIEGGIMFGLAAALYGEISIEKGAVAQDNFDSYQVARMADAPLIEVHFLQSHAPRGGVGEVGVIPIAAAVGNAIFAASGVRVRDLPIRKLKLPPAARASL